MLEYETNFPVELITNRERHLHGEGGALNADYRQVEAVAKIAEICGRHGLKYNIDWCWHTCTQKQILISFSDEKYATIITLALDKGYTK